MAAVITAQPQDSSATVGTTHTFTVGYTTVGNASFQWIVGGQVVDGATSDTFDTLVATTSNSYTTVQVVIIDDSDGLGVTSEVALAISLSAEKTATRHSLVFNYDDNNFTWRDPLIEIGNDVDGYKLYDITWETYNFTPGFQQRWEDWQEGAVRAATWQDELDLADADKTRWIDTFSKGDAKEILQVSNGTVHAADKVDNRQGSLKRYWCMRTQMDMDDMVPEWTTNKIKQIKQFVFHMQSDQRLIDAARDNTVDFYVGWSQNLMEDPNWKSPVTVSLEDRQAGGRYKVDYRTSGRYLSTMYDFTDSINLAFTGGDIDAAETAGR